MTQNRVDALRAMLEQDPNNSFVRYGLAMEFANTGALEQAVAEYRKLLEVKPEYVAAYFHAGQTLERLSRLDEARDMYTKGIEIAAELGDGHTRSELEGALSLIGE